MSLLNTVKYIWNHPVSSRNRLSAFSRFIAWQLRSRLSPNPLIYDWISGSKFYARAGESGITGNIYCGLHEFSDMTFMLHLLRPGDVFFDVGANAGSYTILAGKVAGASGIAFEPVESTHQRLAKNIELNEIDFCCEKIGVGKSGFLATETVLIE